MVKYSIYTNYQMSDTRDMDAFREKLEALFRELDGRIGAENETRRGDGRLPIAKAEVTLLGQMSLLVDERVSAVLALAQTGDMDARLNMEHFAKSELKKLLPNYGLIYDEDSSLIWIPPGARFSELFDLVHVVVRKIDAESALVSKAVKAPEKNKQLIRQAIALGTFPRLMERILEQGGNLERFA
jgi:hypothetical protein